MTNFFNIVIFFFSTISLSLVPISTFAKSASQKNQETLLAVQSHFRSSSPNIDPLVLLNEAIPKIPRELKLKLARMNPQSIIAAAAQCVNCNANQAVVENLIKIHLILKACQDLCINQNLNREISQQYWQLNLGRSLAQFTAAPTHVPKGEFDFIEYQWIQRALKNPLDNDFYNFKQAGIYFAEGKHLTHHSTFRLFSRGHENRNYIVSLGQDQILDMLEHLEFTDFQVAALQNNPEFSKLPKEFFEYLRHFKFKGSIRAVPAGTIVFKDEPIMEITGNTVEVTMIETLVIPWIDKLSSFLTKAVRVKSAAGDRVLVEGGSRRGSMAFWSAYSALLGDFFGTSNVEVATLTKTKALGTEAHQFIGHHPDEVFAHALYREYFPESTLLVDTYDILKGVRAALRASGTNFKGLRIDSTIPGIHKDPTEAKRLTVQLVEDLLLDLGYEPGTYTITLSDGLNENSLEALHAKKAPFKIALVGTEVAAPSDTSNLNSVYKVVEIRDLRDQSIRHPIKLATGKVLQPGQTQLWREYSADGLIVRDVVSLMDEEIKVLNKDGRLRPLLEHAMKLGVKLVPRESVEVKKNYIKSELASLPAKYKQLRPLPEEQKFKFETSAAALAVQERARVAATVAQKPRIAIAPMSGDPLHDDHELLIKRVINTYQLDKLILVLTGEDRVHKDGSTHFSNSERLAMAYRRFPPEDIQRHKVEIWTGEMQGRTRFTVDTVADIKAHANLPKDSEMFVVVGTDVFATLPSWKNASALANEFNWIVVNRAGVNFNFKNLDSSLFADFKRINTETKLQGPRGNSIELYDARLGELSSTDFRSRIQKVRYVFHDVDNQLTFWAAMNGFESGPLAVPDSPRITENIMLLKYLSQISPQIKSTSSGDEHFEIETRHPHLNGEFHPNADGSFPGFSRHGMAGVYGPVGDERIPEVRFFSPSKILEVKHQKAQGQELKLVPFNVEANLDLILDPSYELYLRKNGNGSNSVWVNPHAEKIYQRLAPETIFVYGVATDFCVQEYVNGAVDRGYKVVLVTDAVAGIFAEKTKFELDRMQSRGVQFMTTHEILLKFGQNREVLLGKALAANREMKQKVQAEQRMCRSLFGKYKLAE